MEQAQRRRPAARWWLIALLIFTLVWAFLQVNETWVRTKLEQWGLLAPSWSSGERNPGGEWAPREFVPERPGPRLREVARWNCALVHQVDWFPDGKRLAVGVGVWLSGKDRDGQRRSWCVLELPALRDTGLGGIGGNCLEVSSRGAIALSTHRKGTQKRHSLVEAYAPGATEPCLSFDVAGSLVPMCFTPDGSRLVTLAPEGLLKTWDAETWKELSSLALPKANWSAFRLDIERAGRVAVIGRPVHLANTPLLVDLAGPTVLEPIELPRFLLQGSNPTISPDGRYVAMQTQDPSARGAPIVYDRQTRTALWNRAWEIHNHPVLHTEYVHLARFSPDGKLLAACGDRGHVGLFDARDGALYDQRYEFDPHTTCVRWSPDGTMVAFGGNGGLIVYEVVRPPDWK